MWNASLLEQGRTAPWASADDMYATIDKIQEGDTPWKCFKMSYNGPRPAGQPPKWMDESYELWTRDIRLLLHSQLASTDLQDEFNPAPYRQFSEQGDRIYTNLMSANWAWSQAVRSGLYC